MGPQSLSVRSPDQTWVAPIWSPAQSCMRSPYQTLTTCTNMVTLPDVPHTDMDVLPDAHILY